MAVSSKGLSLERIELPAGLPQAMLDALRMEGRFVVESIVFWAGEIAGRTARVTRILVPKGSGVYKHPLQVRVSDNIIAALCDHLDPPEVILVGQVHTHRGSAFHSEADDSFSFGTRGYLSIVIPTFGSGPAENWRSWSFHECLGGTSFRALSAAEISSRFAINEELALEVYDVRG